MDSRGAHIINRLRQRWIACQLLVEALLAFAIALTLCNAWFVANTITFMILPDAWWLLYLFIPSFGIILFIRRPWMLTNTDVATFLNQTYPQLEESAELLTKESDELSLLQQLQLSKIEAEITAVPRLPWQFFKRFKIALLSLMIAIGITFITNQVTVTRIICALPLPPPPAKVENVLPQIEGVQITINPPAYTTKLQRQQDKFNLTAEEGSAISWQIKTNISLKNLSLIFNNTEKINLKPNSDGTSWNGQKIVTKPGFYQVDADGKLSDLYQIEIIKDHPPLISIKTPKQYTYIDAGEMPRVKVNAVVSDDYDISNALIHATVAKGSGEAVKFKEYSIGFGSAFALRSMRHNLQHLFDLPKLDMQPGDELYFYVEAVDNHQQKTRTDVYTVTIQDTAALLSMNGLVNNPNVKPEYFRSQRQIIMDTELLLKQKDTLSKEAFNNVSNNIATDQKLLRLRYGRFLGEEDESDVGGLGENDELSKIENFNNAAMIQEAMTDKHDNAEDATYFEPGTKAQLKATLTEMWNAELRLRLFKPREALAFEYKALRLLKDLQQKSRAYVAKTSYTTTPLKPEKRLTGELDKIINPNNKQNINALADKYVNLKTAAGLFEQIKLRGTYTDTEKRVLIQAAQQLSLKAASAPGTYLTAVSAMSRILATNKPQMQDVKLVEHALQKMLPANVVLPKNTSAAPDMGLSKYYYQNLKNQNR